MKGLLIKDLCYIRRGKMLLTMVLISLMFAVMDVNYVTSYLVIMTMSLLQSTFSYDEYNGGMQYLMTLPITRKQYVRSKYLLAFLLGAAGLTLGLVFNIGIGLIRGQVDWLTDAVIMAVSLGIILMLGSIYIPVILKFGVEKGRLLSFCILMLMALSITLLATAGYEVLLMALGDIRPVFVVILAFLFGAVVLTASYMTSLRIMEKKEF